MVKSSKKNRTTKTSRKVFASIKKKSGQSLQWLFYFFALGTFLLSQYFAVRKNFLAGIIWFIATIILLYLNYAKFSFLTHLDNWGPNRAPKSLRKDPIRFMVPAFFLAYLMVLLWKPLFHPNLVLGGFDMLFHFPYKIYWINSLKEGDPALWNPYYHAGISFIGWPSASPCSPFNILFFIFPSSYAYSLQVFILFFVSAFGMYFLARFLGAGWKGGVLAGMAFSFGGYYLSRMGQGQELIWFPIAWTPWMVWSAEKALREKKILWIAMTSFFAALAYFEGFPQTTQYSLLILALYLLGAWLFRGASFKIFLTVSLGAVVGFLILTAVVLFPESEYVRLTNRWEWHYADIMENYVTPDALPIFWNPFRGSPFDLSGFKTRMGYHEVANYIGYIPLFLFLTGFFFFRKVPRVFWMNLMAIFFLLVAMGASNPVSKRLFDFFYYFIPLFNHHRSIGRLMIIPIFFMACSAGLMFGAVENWIRSWKGKFWAWLPLMALIVTAVDLWHYGHPFINVVDPMELIGKRKLFSENVMTKVLADPTYPRIQSSADFPANLPYKVAQPLYLEGTLPKHAARFFELMHDNYDTPMSDLVNLRYLHYGGPAFASSRWKSLGEDEDWYNTMALPRAFVVGGYYVHHEGEKEDVVMIQQKDLDCSKEVILYSEPKGISPSQPDYLGEAKITHYGNNNVEMECTISKPGLLFLSDTYFPGWNAWVDGQKTEILRADRAFRALVLPKAGSHKIRMVFQPFSFKLGACISIFGWLGWAFIVFRKRNLELNF